MIKMVICGQWLRRHSLAVIGIILAAWSLYEHNIYSAYHWSDGRRSADAYDASLLLGIIALLISVFAYLLAFRKKEMHLPETVAIGISITALVSDLR
jgi:hypothetical protein